MIGRVVVVFGLMLAMGCTVQSDNADGADGGGGGTGGNDGPACGEPGRTGVTDCEVTLGTCPTGQYCNSEMVTCSVGCLSDNNCAANQYCDLSASTPGVCAQCMSQAPDPEPNPEPNPEPDPEPNPEPDPEPNPEPDPEPDPVEQQCRQALVPFVDCGALTDDEAIEFAAQCGLAPADLVRMFLAALEACVNATNDCDELNACFVEASPDPEPEPDPEPNPEPEPGLCEVDEDCDQTQAAMAHEICFGGECVLGCRADEDCGQDWVCDDFVDPPQCSPF